MTAADTWKCQGVGMESGAPELSDIRRIHRTIDPYHTVVYFSDLAANRYAECGLHGASGYFASRSAALGPVPPQVVVATFFNFAPRLVHRALEGAWDHAAPEEVLQARLEVADGTLRAHLGPEVIESTEMVRAAEIARRVAGEAATHGEGRALFAAHAALAWPTDPHLELWHALTLLREFRGDAHIAALLTAGLDGIDAIVLHAASRKVPAAFLRSTRGWSDAEWSDTVTLHRATGWLAAEDGPDGEPVLSENGTAMREEIETATDRASALPWLTLDREGLEELRLLVRPWARALSDAMFAGLGQGTRGGDTRPVDPS